MQRHIEHICTNIYP